MNNNLVNLVVAIILSILIIFGWQFFYERPRLAKLASETKLYNQQIKSIKKRATSASSEPIFEKRSKAIKSSKRVTIKSKLLSGSISLTGARFDDLSLLQYRKNLDKDSDVVELFSPSNSSDSYFAEVGWWSSNKGITYPNASTVWISDKDTLSEGGTVNLHWTNPENIKFKISISLNEDYLFTIKQSTENNSAKTISMQYYTLINRLYEQGSERMVNILHQGMIGSISSELKEYSYESIKKDKKNNFAKSNVDWIGITDKYWLSAFIPDKKDVFLKVILLSEEDINDLF